MSSKPDCLRFVQGLVATVLMLSPAAAAAQTAQLPVSDNTGRLTIRVIDSWSLGVPGAAVYLRSGEGQPRLDVLTFSSGNGTAHVDGLPVGRYKLVVTLSGFHESRRVVHVFRGDDHSLDVVLQVNPKACVVVDGHGEAMGRIQGVRARPLARMAIVTEGGFWPEVSRVSPDGTFGWCRPPTANREVSVVFEPFGRTVLRHAGGATTAEMWRKAIDIEATQESVRADLTMLASRMNAPTAVGPGRVIADSSPIPGAAVSFVNLRTENDQATTVTSNEHGEYDVPVLPQGFYRVTATLSGFVDGVAYWRSGDPSPVLELQIGHFDQCMALPPLLDFRLVNRSGAPLAGAHFVTVSPDGRRSAQMPVRGGRPGCFRPDAADELRLDIEGLGEMILKNAGVEPATLRSRITIDWTELVARRLRRQRQ